MKRFLVLYRAPHGAREQMAKATPEQGRAAMQAWQTWATDAGPSIVDLGAPVATAAHLRGGNTTDFVAGYSVMQAESPARARALFEAHPHLSMPGASIEILECLPLSGA